MESPNGEFNAAFLAAVQKAVADGKSVDDAVAGLTLPQKFKSYGMRSAKETSPRSTPN